MISLVSFFFFFLLSCKPEFNVNSLMYIDSFCLCMVLICGLVFFFILFLPMDKWSFFNSFNFFLIVFLSCCCFFCSSMYLFMSFFEASMFPMILLIFFTSTYDDKISSILFMMMFNLAGSLPFMIFLSVLWDKSFDFLTSNFLMINSDSLVILALFSLIFLFKIPIFLSHFWLTKAHVSASAQCSMFLASIMLKLGSLGVYKFVTPFSTLTFYFSGFVSFFLTGLVLFSGFMIRYYDMKVLVAYSSVLHMSMIFPFLTLGDFYSVMSSFYMLLGHGICSLVLFKLVKIFYEVFYNRGLDFFSSAESFSKDLSFWLFIFFLMNLGFPPFIGFLTELFACSSLINYSSWSCVWFCILVVIFMIPFMFFLTKSLFGKKFIFGLNFFNSAMNLDFFILIFIYTILPFFF